MANDYVSSVLKPLFLLLLVFWSQQQHADSASMVKFLPGFEGPLPFELETGYIGVGEEEEVQLFYYFIKSERNPEDDPLFLWLSGGPGCSSISGLLFENGKHEEFISNPFYVGGDSYSGKVVPALVQEISKGNYKCCRPPINLQGYVLGNPVTDFETDFNSHIPFAHGMALISDELYESLKIICKGKYVNVDPSNTECLKLVEEYKKCTETVNPYLILEPLYGAETPDSYVYRYLLATNWANDESVRKALQINKESIGRWIRCNLDIPYTHDIISSVPYHVDNSMDGYRSLIYSGDHDLGIPYLGTQAWIRSLNYSVIDDWRPWMINQKLAGYTRTYANKMTFATIKGGGHTAEFKPEESSVMFQRWINGEPL